MSSDNTQHIAPELSIVIISYNTAQITRNTIDSIYASMSNKPLDSFEIVVLDNDSKDDSVAVLKSLQQSHANLKLIEIHENLGFSKGNNTAVKHTRGNYLFFLNSDIIVQDDAIDQALEYYKKNEDTVQFLGGKLLNEDRTPQTSCGPFYTPLIVFGALFLRGDYWGLTRQSPDETQKVDWVSGACILTKRTIFDELGGFDEGIFMYMEEIDLLYRASKKGYNTYIFPHSRFIHLGSASSQGKTYPILQVYNGFIYFYKKHYSQNNVRLLKGMLQLKAGIAVLLGRLTGRAYLINTYEKAFKIASMA